MALGCEEEPYREALRGLGFRGVGSGRLGFRVLSFFEALKVYVEA